MKLVPFAAPRGDIVYVNPELVTSVEPGSHYYNPEVEPRRQTFIGTANGGLFVNEPLNAVLYSLREVH